MGYGVVQNDSSVCLMDTSGTRMADFPFDKDLEPDWAQLSVSLENIQSDKQSVGKVDSETDLIIYTDGGSRGNPGPSASGYVIMDAQEQIIEDGGEYLGITTNNQAEYQAVKLALEQAYKFNPKRIHFKIDSLLVVNQMIGKFKIKNKDLWPINESIRRLIQEHDAKVAFTHVRREFNKLADQKVNEVLDSRTSD